MVYFSQLNFIQLKINNISKFQLIPNVNISTYISLTIKINILCKLEFITNNKKEHLDLNRIAIHKTNYHFLRMQLLLQNN